MRAFSRFFFSLHYDAIYCRGAVIATLFTIQSSLTPRIPPMNQSETCEAFRTALEAPSDQSLRVACYCEENVWRLAHRRLHHNPKSTYYVVFVSNEQKCVAMWYQMAGTDGAAVFWDYHVILVETTPNHETFVLDMDSQLPYPCPFQEYVEDTFLEAMGQYAPLFWYVCLWHVYQGIEQI